jgi:hypothetical protein
MRNEGMKIEKETYCQPEIRVHAVGSVLMSAASNTLPVVPGETVTEEEQLSKPSYGWWDEDFEEDLDDDFW